MLPVSGTLIVKKSDGDDWFEEVLDSSDIPVYSSSGTNFQDANISGSQIEEVLGKVADQLILKALESDLTSTSGNLQSQIDSNDTDISDLQSDLSTASGSLQGQITSNDNDISQLQADLSTASGSLQSQINSNDLDIGDLQADLITASGSLQTQISNNDTDIFNLQTDLTTASGSLQSQITSNDSDIFQLQSDLTSASGALNTEILESRESVQVPLTSGTDMLVTNNQLPLTSGSAIQIGSNYIVGANSITLSAIGSYRVSWVVGALQTGTTANNRGRNPEITLNRNAGTFDVNTSSTGNTDLSSGHSSDTMTGSALIQTAGTNETVALRSRDLSANSTASVALVVRNGYLKVERIE